MRLGVLTSLALALASLEAVFGASTASALTQPNNVVIPTPPGCAGSRPSGLLAAMACVCTQPGILTFTVVTRGTAQFANVFGWYNVTGQLTGDAFGPRANTGCACDVTARHSSNAPLLLLALAGLALRRRRAT